MLLFLFGRMLALVRIKGATRQRGLELRLRDLGKIWVSGFGPWEPAAANAAPYVLVLFFRSAFPFSVWPSLVK